VNVQEVHSYVLMEIVVLLILMIVLLRIVEMI